MFHLLPPLAYITLISFLFEEQDSWNLRVMMGLGKEASQRYRYALTQLTIWLLHKHGPKILSPYWTIWKIPPWVRDSNAVVNAAVRMNGLVLGSASDRLRDMEPVVKAAFQSHWAALKYASERLKGSPSFVLSMLSSKKLTYRSYYHLEEFEEGQPAYVDARMYNILSFVDESLKANTEFMRKATIAFWRVFLVADIRIKNLWMIANAAVEQNREAMYFASPAQKRDRMLFLAAISSRGGSFGALRPLVSGFEDDIEVMKALMERNYHMLDSVSEDSPIYREVVLIALKSNWRALKYASAACKNDRGIVTAAIKLNCNAIAYASDTLRGNPEMMKMVTLQQQKQKQKKKQDPKPKPHYS
jgi:hypothetical protein